MLLMSHPVCGLLLVQPEWAETHTHSSVAPSESTEVPSVRQALGGRRAHERSGPVLRFSPAVFVTLDYEAFSLALFMNSAGVLRLRHT